MIARQDVRLVIANTMVEVPEEVVEWREAIVQEQERIKASGREPMWNGSSYAVDYVSVSRVPDVEDARISIGLQWSNYFTFLAAQQLDRPMRDGQTLRSRYLDGKHWSSVPPFISSSFGINVAVTTADNQIILSKRSGQVGTQPNVWNSSANEGLSRELATKADSGQARWPPGRPGRRCSCRSAWRSSRRGRPDRAAARPSARCRPGR
ncbi:hypothetical protein ABZU32_36130 [Sphaerisporangium sp. NPDC005288]|uniref:hypothetical protein n=1 Tax=Sphaerisporangium sp. NPDC005288 TaxID=3155114 RepID=UPI0033ACDDCD